MGARASPAQLLGCISSVRVGARALPRWERLETAEGWVHTLEVPQTGSSYRLQAPSLPVRTSGGGAALGWGVVVRYCA